MNGIRPVVTYSFRGRSIVLWTASLDGADYWGILNEFTGKSLGCVSFEHASFIFDRCQAGVTSGPVSLIN